MTKGPNKLNAKNEIRRFSVLTSSKQEITKDRRILLKVTASEMLMMS